MKRQGWSKTQSGNMYVVARLCAILHECSANTCAYFTLRTVKSGGVANIRLHPSEHAVRLKQRSNLMAHQTARSATRQQDDILIVLSSLETTRMMAIGIECGNNVQQRRRHPGRTGDLELTITCLLEAN